MAKRWIIKTEDFSIILGYINSKTKTLIISGTNVKEIITKFGRPNNTKYYRLKSGDKPSDYELKIDLKSTATGDYFMSLINTKAGVAFCATLNCSYDIDKMSMSQFLISNAGDIDYSYDNPTMRGMYSRNWYKSDVITSNFGYAARMKTITEFADWDEYTEPDPFKPGGETDTGGGNGDFDGTTVSIEKPPLPALSAVSAGFVSLYNPSLEQINALASYMWSDAFSLDTFKKLFADPMDAILGLNIVPVRPSVGETTNVKIGNISTDISMPPISSQYVERDCGTLEVKEYWGAYLDYEPFTRAELYLPYIGIRQISVDDIMGKSVQVIYHIDILSGACIAYVICSGTVLYSFSGQCAATIPMTGQDWTNVVNGVLSIAASVVGLATGGGAMAAGVLGGVASTAVNQMKPDIQKSGSLSGVGGLLGVQTPYLILTRPRQALPARQNTFRGYPSFITVKLSDISGYTEVESIHLENVPATNEELQEIDALLHGGVIF